MRWTGRLDRPVAVRGDVLWLLLVKYERERSAGKVGLPYGYLSTRRYAPIIAE